MQIAKKYGLIAGMVYVIIELIKNMYELWANGGWTSFVLWIIPFMLTFAITYVAVKELREEDGSLTTGKGVKLGVTIGLIAGLLTGVFTLIYTQLIDTNLIARVLEVIEEGLEDQNMEEGQISQTLKIYEVLLNPIMTIPVTVISYVIGGLIKGAISGAILKRDVEV